jgi:hypothetical protein
VCRYLDAMPEAKKQRPLKTKRSEPKPLKFNVTRYLPILNSYP